MPNRRPTPVVLRRVLMLTVSLVSVVGFPATASAQVPPEATLPPPPVTVQDVVNELLPLIRQLQPITDQIGPLVAQADPFLEAGADFSVVMAEMGAQLAPFIAQVAPLVEGIGSALAPLWETIDAQVTPGLQDLLTLLGPYLNQVDLATGFQVLGPFAPTVFKVVPTMNKFYDGLDALAPLRDPITCPVSRAIPHQQLLEIVVPFLCFEIVSGPLPTGGGTPVPTGEEAPGSSTPPVPTPEGDPTPAPAALDGPAGSPSPARPAPPLPSTGGASTAAGAPSPVPRTLSTVDTGDDRVEALEARMRMLLVLATGIGLLLWMYFAPVATDGAGGLGVFRRPRTEAPPPLT